MFDSQPPPPPEHRYGPDEDKEPEEEREDAPAEPNIQPADIDAWFGERERMIAALQRRREALRLEVDTISERLSILGVQQANEQDTPPRQPARSSAAKRRTATKKAAAPPSPKAPTPSASGIPSLDRVLVGMQLGKAVSARALVEGLGLNYQAVWRALNTALQRGLVKRTGENPNMLWTRVA